MPGTDSRVVAGGHADAAIGNGKLDLAVTHRNDIQSDGDRRGSTLMSQKPEHV